MPEKIIKLDKIGIEIEGKENSDFLNVLVSKAINDNYDYIGKDYYNHQFEIKTGAFEINKFKENFISEMLKIFEHYKIYESSISHDFGCNSAMRFIPQMDETFNGLHIHTSYNTDELFTNNTFLSLSTILCFSYALALTSLSERIAHSHHIWGKYLYTSDNFRGSNPKYEPVHISEERVSNELAANNNMHLKKDKTIEFRLFDSILPDLFVIETIYEFLLKIQILANLNKDKIKMTQYETVLLTHGIFQAISKMENVANFSTRRNLYYYMLRNKYLKDYFYNTKLLDLFLPYKVLTEELTSDNRGSLLLNMLEESYGNKTHLNKSEVLDITDSETYESLMKESKNLGSFMMCYNEFAVYTINKKIEILKRIENIIYNSVLNTRRASSFAAVYNKRIKNMGLDGNTLYPMLGIKEKEGILYDEDAGSLPIYCCPNREIKFNTNKDFAHLRRGIFIKKSSLYNFMFWQIYTFILQFIYRNFYNPEEILCTQEDITSVLSLFMIFIEKNETNDLSSIFKPQNSSDSIMTNLVSNYFKIFKNLSKFIDSRRWTNYPFTKIKNDSTSVKFIQIGDMGFNISALFLEVILESHNAMSHIYRTITSNVGSNFNSWLRSRGSAALDPKFHIDIFVSAINEINIEFYIRIQEFSLKYTKIQLEIKNLLLDNMENQQMELLYNIGNYFKTNISYGEVLNFYYRVPHRTTKNKLNLKEIHDKLFTVSNLSRSSKRELENGIRFFSDQKFTPLQNLIIYKKTGIKSFDKILNSVADCSQEKDVIFNLLFINELYNSNIDLSQLNIDEILSFNYFCLPAQAKFLTLTEKLMIILNRSFPSYKPSKKREYLFKSLLDIYLKDGKNLSGKDKAYNYIKHFMLSKFKLNI